MKRTALFLLAVALCACQQPAPKPKSQTNTTISNQVTCSASDGIAVYEWPARKDGICYAEDAPNKANITGTGITIIAQAASTSTSNQYVIVKSSVPCPVEARSDRILKQLKDSGWPDRPYVGMDIWLHNASAADVWQLHYQIDCLRPWVATLHDECTKKAYEHWIKEYQDGADAAQRELDFHAIRNRQDAFSAELEEQERASRKDRVALPKLPQCNIK
jgi:hypothetical protein